MDTYKCLDYYTHFTETWKDYSKPSTIITKEVLDIQKIDHTLQCNIFQLIPSVVSDKFIASIKTNSQNSHISKILLFSSNDFDTSIFKSDKVIFIRLTDIIEVQYCHIFKYMDNNIVNIFLIDYVVLDQNSSIYLKSIKSKELLLFSSKSSENITCEFNAFAVKDNPIFSANYYINMYGSLNLLIRKFYMNAYKLINVSNIIETIITDTNIDCSKKYNYINLPTFFLFFCIPQNTVEEYTVDFDSLSKTLESDIMHKNHSIDLTSVYKNVQDYIPILDQIKYTELENRIKSAIYFKCKKEFLDNTEFIDKTRKILEEEIKEKVNKIQEQKQKIVETTVENYRKNIVDQIDTYKKINIEIIDSELDTYKKEKTREIDDLCIKEFNKRIETMRQEIDEKKNREEISFETYIRELYESKYADKVEELFQENLKKKNEQLDEIAKDLLERKNKVLEDVHKRRVEEKDAEFDFYCKQEEERIKQKLSTFELQERVKITEYLESLKVIETEKLLFSIKEHVQEYTDSEKEKVDEEMFKLRHQRSKTIETEFDKLITDKMNELNSQVRYFKTNKTRRRKWYL